MKRRQFLEAAGALAAAGFSGWARAATEVPYGLKPGKPYKGAASEPTYDWSPQRTGCETSTASLQLLHVYA
jgi:hypothetical protein